MRWLRYFAPAFVAPVFIAVLAFLSFRVGAANTDDITLGDATHYWPSGSCMVWDQLYIATGYRPFDRCYELAAAGSTVFDTSNSVLYKPVVTKTVSFNYYGHELFYIDENGKIVFTKKDVTREQLARAFVDFALRSCR